MVVLQMRQNRNYDRRFKTMFENSMVRLAGFDRPPVYYRVMLFLMTVLDPIQFRRMSAREISDEIGMSRISAERALSMLETDKVIFCKGATGAKARRLNNQVVWSSSSEKWNSAVADPVIQDARGR